ncbi:uncharacterized protein LOC142168437 [Nicotiana tabacum]|uniref:Uncharacterized protein LOC142168437 n=1 Tax=Nicotiana tabacum TaxID=4097 RepID=A0AC58SJR5_TOBAC
MESFVNMGKIEGYKKFLGFQNCLSNINGKIWFFWSFNYTTTIHASDEQQMTIKIDDGAWDHRFWITYVYARCTTVERQDLWDSIEKMNMRVDCPWYIEGDLNVIWDSSDKLGRKHHKAYKSLDFINCLNNCGMVNIGYVGSTFTWCNNRRPKKRIWKRLDKIFVNNDWEKNFQYNSAKHLARIESNHRALFVTTHNDQQDFIKYFRFLNFRIDQPGFQDIVIEVWQTQILGDPMWRLQAKLKLLSRRLSQWSKEVVGSINDQVNCWEAKMQALEELGIIHNTEQGREELNRAHSEYTRWLGSQEVSLK